jgi:predicted NACHT family NTPase
MPLDLLIQAIQILTGSQMIKDKLHRSEVVIKLLKQFGLDPEHPPADFESVYQYTLVEYGVGKPKPCLQIFRQTEIQSLFRSALTQNNPSLWLKSGESFLAGAAIAQEVRALGLDPKRELGAFAAVFIQVAKRTRTPAEVLTNHQLESLHSSVLSIVERLERLPTVEGIRTEMARLASQDLVAPDQAADQAALPASARSRTFALAQQLQGWFETLGYQFESYECWEDQYFEWVIDIPVRRGRYDRILVRGIEGVVQLSDVMDLGRSVETQRADEGWLVTTRRISPAARAEVSKPENEVLACYTFDELLDQDADFSGYLVWLESEIQKRQITDNYVPLGCAKEELDPMTQQRLAVSRYGEGDGWVDGYVDQWLDDPAKEHISVLGEFGTGKTWFVFHYAWMALQRYRDAQQRGIERPRLPIVIPLRDYAKAVSVESLFSEFFFRKHEVRSLTYSAFEQLNRMGKLLLIFDGFDEMAARVDRQEMVNNFWELAKVVVPGSKVILTCRTEHFPEAREGRALLNAELKASTDHLAVDTPQFEVLELEKFNDEQIRQVLALQASASTVEQVMGNPQLLDLARRPVMTELILEALPDIEAGKPVDMSRIYLYAVRRKMERDIKAERTFTSLADKLYFMCELSWEMLSTDQMSLNYKFFPERIRTLFGVEEKDLDHWHYDMMGQTMLIRNAEGDYTPAHRSLLEFFVAYKFAAELGAIAPDVAELAEMRPLRYPRSSPDGSLPPQQYRWSEYFGQSQGQAPLSRFVRENLEGLRSGFGKAPLTKAVTQLMLPILNDDHLLFTLLEQLQGLPEESVQYIGGNAATLLVKLDPKALEGKNLTSIVMHCADFSSASLRRVNFAHADLSDCAFTGIFSQIFSVAYQSQGRYFATGDANGEIRVWQADNNQLLWSRKEHNQVIRSLAFSPDGNTLVSGSIDCTIKLWNVQNGDCLQTLTGHQSAVRSVTFHPNGTVIASGSEDKTLKLWQVSSGLCIQTLHEGEGYVRSVAFDGTGDRLAYGGENYAIKILDFHTLQCIQSLVGHQGWVKSVAFSPDGKTLVSGGQDCSVRFWDLQRGECLHTQSEHNAQVNAVTFSHDGKTIASCGSDHTVSLWDGQTGQRLKVLRGHDNWVQSLAFSPTSETLISGGQDHAVKIWDTQSGECLSVLQGYSNWLKAIEYSPDARTLASSGQDCLVRLWDVATGECVRELKGHTKWVHALAFSPDGMTLISCGDDCTVRLWNAQTGECLHCFAGQERWVRACAFSPDGRMIVSGSDDSTVCVWDAQTYERLHTFLHSDNRVRSVAFSADSQMIMSRAHDDAMRFWDLHTGDCVRQFSSNTHLWRSLVFSPDRRCFASGGDDYQVRVWDVQTGKSLAVLAGHTGQVKSVGFSLDGQWLASGSDDLTIRLWNLTTLECTQVLLGHIRTVSAFSFNPLAPVLASCSEDGQIKLWNYQDGNCLQTMSSDRPYEGMNITGTKGLTESEIVTLKTLGALSSSP